MFSWWKRHSVPAQPEEQPAPSPAGANEHGAESEEDQGDPVGEAQALLSSGSHVARLDTAVCYLPHPDKVSYGGEDAHFVSLTGGGALGVADGVGGWQESGVNPAEYSRTFMRLARSYLEGSDGTQEPQEGWYLVDPKGALDVAHQGTKVAGSATACVMQLDQRNNTFVAANLGDSGFIIIRGRRVLARSKPLQHYFDCPLQFGAFPEYVDATDTADQADLYQIAVQPGDYIVAGSDGLWDNTFDEEIVAIVRKAKTTQDAANALATLAREHASDPEFASPYAREALSQGLDLSLWEKLMGATIKNGRLHLRRLTGGKQDDITVMVAKVVVQPKRVPGEGSPGQQQHGVRRSVEGGPQHHGVRRSGDGVLYQQQPARKSGELVQQRPTRKSGEGASQATSAMQPPVAQRPTFTQQQTMRKPGDAAAH